VQGRLVRYLLILITSWGVVSTTVVAVLILFKDSDPDHRAIIKMAIGYYHPAGAVVRLEGCKCPAGNYLALSPAKW
jgi:hypothetical protein